MSATEGLKVDTPLSPTDAAAQRLTIKGIEAADEEAKSILAYFIEDPERAIRQAISAGCYSAPRKYDVIDCRFLNIEKRMGKEKDADYSIVKLIVTIEAGTKKDRYREQAEMTVFSNDTPTFVYWIRNCRDF
jgi:hypothetical protein